MQMDPGNAFVWETVTESVAESPKHPYPIETEHDMVDAIGVGNWDTAQSCLNQLIDHLFTTCTDHGILLTRLAELLAVMGRGALYSGANSDEVFAICHQYSVRLHRQRCKEQMAICLLECLRQLIQMMYVMMDSKHKSAMHRSINYIQKNCAEKLTLRQVAESVGYSPSYYSHLFREELGCTFQTFLNQIRVQKSKTLLLSTTLSSAEIGGLVGFGDQSYFGKVFKRFTGVTPDQYRKRRRRIDDARERDKADS